MQARNIELVTVWNIERPIIRDKKLLQYIIVMIGDKTQRYYSLSSS